MNFPFSITQKINFKQSTDNNISETELLEYIESQLESLNMEITQIGENELHLQKPDMIKGLRRKNFLRNLTVKLQTLDTNIQITLTTNTALICVLGILPYGLLFLKDNEINVVALIIISSIILAIGLLPRLIVLSSITFELKKHLNSIDTSKN